MIYKYKDIETNINNKTVDIGNVGVRFYTEDENTGSIRIFIKWNGKNVDLDSINMRPKLDLFLSDGSIFIDEAINIISSKSGLIQYNIPNKVIKHAGVVNAKLFLESELESVHVANFSFNIVDSGVEDKVQKEISLNLVEDTVKRIMSDDLTELLDNGFKTELTTDLQNYISDNSEQFKGPRGEKGETGEQGVEGKQGIPGERGLPGVDGKSPSLPDFSNWQKSKLVNDNGLLEGFSGLDWNNPEILLGNKSMFGYASATKNSPGLQSTGFFIYLVRTPNYAKLEFSPYNTNQTFKKTKKNGVWTEWEETNVKVTGTDWITLPLTNDANGFQLYPSFMLPSYKIVSIGERKIISIYGIVTNINSNTIFANIPRKIAPPASIQLRMDSRLNNNSALFNINANGTIRSQGTTNPNENYVFEYTWTV